MTAERDRSFAVVVDDEENANARDALILTVPGVAEEVERYTPVVRKLTDISLLAIIVTAERETRRRADKLRGGERWVTR